VAALEGHGLAGLTPAATTKDTMVESLRNIFQVGELRNRVLFTLGMLAVYRIGNHVVVPGVNTEALAMLAEQARNTMFGLYDMFSGQNLSKMTIFALGIMPYISASIILQLLTVVWPYLEKLSKEGELGRRKITQYTRYGTILLAVVQAASIAVFLERQTDIAGGLPLVYSGGWGFRLMTILTLTTGTALVMWIGEQITERGIGNGMSLIIFAGIVVGLPRAVLTTFEQLSTGQMSLLRLILLVVLMVAVIAAIIFVERGQRRVTVQYAKRLVGRRMYGGTSTHIPLKVNTGGVIPVIFASSLLALPATIAGILPTGGWGESIITQLSYGMPLYNLLYVSGIIFFAYFYTAIIFNPDDVAENMRKYGGFVPGIRPGKRTAEYIDTILTRITLVGAVYLALVAILPEFLITGFKVAPIPFIGETLDANLPEWFTQGMNVSFFFGGTSLLIIVGVAMDTVQQVESQLIMRHYDGFMRKTRIRGRRG
jgi:preprotein translocase subunit SecY